MRRGHTLFELILVLMLVGIAGSVLVGAGSSLHDRTAVIAAREALAGLVAEARSEALSRGGATVHVSAAPWRAWSEARGTTFRTLELEKELGVSVVLAGSRTSSELNFDALGLGRVASETVLFRRGDAEAGLVISAFGRVRRR
jgi:Tfp pilus assembly protein FimT